MLFHVIWCFLMLFFDLISCIYLLFFGTLFFIKGEAMGGCSDLEVVQLCSSASWERGVSPIPPNGEGKGKSSTQTCRLSGEMLVPRRGWLCVGWVVSAKPVWKIPFRKCRKDGRIIFYIYCKSEWSMGEMADAEKTCDPCRSKHPYGWVWIGFPVVRSIVCWWYDVGDFLF